MSNAFAVGFFIFSLLPLSLDGQTRPLDSVPVRQPRQNMWLSGGLGVATNGLAVAGTVWYSHDDLAFGAHAAEAAPLFAERQRVDEQSVLAGVRDLGGHELLLIALGPSLLSGWRLDADPYSATVNRSPEVGLTVAAEAALTTPLVGIGLDAFASRSKHRRLAGITLSLQLGWLGRDW